MVIDCQDMWGFDGSGLWVANIVTCTLISCKDEEVVNDSDMDWRGYNLCVHVIDNVHYVVNVVVRY